MERLGPIQHLDSIIKLDTIFNIFAAACEDIDLDKNKAEEYKRSLFQLQFQQTSSLQTNDVGAQIAKKMIDRASKIITKRARHQELRDRVLDGLDDVSNLTWMAFETLLRVIDISHRITYHHAAAMGTRDNLNEDLLSLRREVDQEMGKDRETGIGTFTARNVGIHVEFTIDKTIDTLFLRKRDVSDAI
jgi:hypothetical protein